MNDPFASLDPIQKPKTAAEHVLSSPAYSHSAPPGTPVAVAPFGAGAPGHMDMGGMHMNMAPGMGMSMAPSMGMPAMGSGGMGMGMGMNSGMPPVGGMGMNMNMNMNMGMGSNMSMGMNQPPHNPFQPPQQQQQPVMYDNIKNLLQQKPKAPAAFEDSASMDFLENLGGAGGGSAFGSAKTNSGSSFSVAAPQVRAAEPTSMPVTADPFGGGFGASPVSPSMGSGDIGLSIFETGGGNSGGSASNPVSPSGSSSGGAKSSALADRLANGRRKTQEAQRSQLQFNANSFAQPGGTTGPKISLKEMVGQAPSKPAADSASSIVSLDDFASGGVAASGDFSGSSDPFGGRGGSFGSSAATNSGGAVRQSSFEDSEPKPVDENDNTFW